MGEVYKSMKAAELIPTLHCKEERMGHLAHNCWWYSQGQKIQDQWWQMF